VSARLRTMARPMPLFAPVTAAIREGVAILAGCWVVDHCENCISCVLAMRLRARADVMSLAKDF
jgi:hypothetical protein